MTLEVPAPLAAICYPRGFDVDRLLVDVCAQAAAAGLQLGGLIQLATGERGGNCAATTHVVDLRTRAAFNIWEDRGACASGCRLDERGLADAEPVIMQAIVDRVDLLVINRFGRAESLGRGLRACFEAAIAADVPVLTAVREPYDVAWNEFHGGIGCGLPPDHVPIINWISNLNISVPPRRHSQQLSEAV
jgi:hypothetical protein